MFSYDHKGLLSHIITVRIGLLATIDNGTFLGQKCDSRNYCLTLSLYTSILVSALQSSVTVVFVAKNVIAMDDIVASLTLAAL